MAKDLMSMTPEERAKHHNEQRAKENAPSPDQLRQMKEISDQERMRRAGDTAPTTKTEMGKRFAAGGATADDAVSDWETAKKRERAGRRAAPSNPSSSEKQAYDQLQNMREEDVETVVKRRGISGHPHANYYGREGMEYRERGYAAGGGVSRGDGIAQRGRTKGRMI